MEKNPRVSIITVHYRAGSELLHCLSSLEKAGPEVPYEIIVVDNDQDKNFREELRDKFPEVNYVKSPGNIGFGAANNLGEKKARGEYLFFLNPDTLIFPPTLEKLVDFLDTNKEAGIVAPIMLNEKKNLYPLQAGKLTPLTAVFALSFLNKYFSSNPFSQRYWLKNWQGDKPREVETAPGTAFLIRREVFQEISGFDPQFFLFFEEMDLCLRVKKAGWRIFLEPEAKIIHLGERSTTDGETTKKIFRQSRFYYFQKHWGSGWALLVESFLRSSEWLAQLF